MSTRRISNPASPNFGMPYPQRPDWKHRIARTFGRPIGRLAWFAVVLWLWFITLPSLDKSQINADGSILHPTRGTPGSCYCTTDGQHYVRTRGGVRKVGKAVGKMLIARSKRIRRVAIMQRVVVGAGVVAVAFTAVHFTHRAG